MPKIFISYRRADSAYVAGMLSEKLEECFGDDAVFIDIDTIPIGVDFREHINKAVGECDVLLAVIGDSWVNIESEDGQRRIHMPNDFVRIEIESALKREIHVVPVLIENAQMPSEEELPKSLHALPFRNAAEIRPGRDLKHHVDLLIDGLKVLLKDEEKIHATRPLGIAGDSGTANVPAKQKMTYTRKLAYTAVAAFLFLMLSIYLGDTTIAAFMGIISLVVLIGTGILLFTKLMRRSLGKELT